MLLYVFFLQETNLKNIGTLSLRGYCVRKNFLTDARAGNGVAIRERDTQQHDSVAINIELQVVAVRGALPIQVTVCSNYHLLSVRVDIPNVIDAIDQIPTPFILLGDFNSHNIF